MKKVFLFLTAVCCYFGTVLGQDFTFALLTDTHISHKNPAPAEDLKRVIKEVNENPNIDFVAVSGDISEEEFGDSPAIIIIFTTKIPNMREIIWGIPEY